MPKRKKAKLNILVFDKITDPVIEHLREYYKEKQDIKQDLDKAVLDEICLEGLTGQVYPRLLELLDAIYPDLSFKTNEQIQNYVWQIIVNRYLQQPDGANVKAYFVNKKKRTKSVEGKTEIKLPKKTVERFVPGCEMSIYPIQDGNILGSCRDYSDRVDITNEILKCYKDNVPRGSLEKLHKQYGLNNIYLVAAPDLRRNSIIPAWADPNIDIKVREYCILELIGKSRTMGAVFPNDKALGRYRIMLESKSLISQYQEKSQGFIIHHLLRFSKDPNHKPKANLNQEDYYEFEVKEHCLRSVCCNLSKLKADRDVLTMVYDIIALSDGCTQIELRKKLRFPKFHLRNHLKNLLALKLICSRTDKTGDKPVRVYKTTHKSFRRKMIKREKTVKKPARGIMASWDDADLRAKKTLGHKRSCFNQAEDSLLILCHITSLLLHPKLRKLSYCVNKRVIRDVLHEELIESHDKTSDACLRRIKYLKKLPNNIMSINELTAELRDDLDVTRVVNAKKAVTTDQKFDKLFIHLLKTVRSKMPNLLGLNNTLRRIKPFLWTSDKIKETHQIESYDEFHKNFELSECQSVASISRLTYEPAKNMVDIRYNNVLLVTLAFAMTNNFGSKINPKTIWLLNRFYSVYPEKLVNSVISKLTKRSLLVRKNPTPQKKQRHQSRLNQSVLFLLNRYQSSSLMQLAYPISPRDPVVLSESNEMSLITLLASFCSSSLFELDLELKIPKNVVEIDKGNGNFNEDSRDYLARFVNRCGELSDSLIVQPCQVKFSSDKLASAMKNTTINAMDKFIEQSKPIECRESAATASAVSQSATLWLVKSHSLVTSESQNEGTDIAEIFEAQKVPVEYSARLWKSIDGSVHMETLFKLIQSLLSWIIMFPGVEFKFLRNEFGHLMPDEHLLELLNLMKELNLISITELRMPTGKPLLFGRQTIELDNTSSLNKKSEMKTYEASASAFIEYCHLLERYCKSTCE